MKIAGKVLELTTIKELVVHTFFVSCAKLVVPTKFTVFDRIGVDTISTVDEIITETLFTANITTITDKRSGSHL